jgi:hypothetical protein
MTHQRFKEIWDSKLGKDTKFKCPDHLAKSLIKASNGDFSDFDKIQSLLSIREDYQEGFAGNG